MISFMLFLFNILIKNNSVYSILNFYIESEYIFYVEYIFKNEYLNLKVIYILFAKIYYLFLFHSLNFFQSRNGVNWSWSRMGSKR